MRICFFNRSYSPDLGATGQLLGELAEDLVRDYGCEVSVVAGPPLLVLDSRRSGGLMPVRRERRNGVDLFRAGGTTFRRNGFARRATNYLTYFLTASVAGFLVRRADVVISLTDPPIIGLAAFLTARRCGAKFVFVCQDVFPEVGRLLEDFRSETVNRALDRISRFLIRKADRVVALGETMRTRLIEEKGAEPRKVAVIHNWADCSAIAPGPRRSAFAFVHDLADRFVVMHSGNMGLSQGLEHVVEAAARLQGVPGILFVFVGDGVKRSALEAQVQGLGLRNVRFLPYQPKERLAESFASADVFVVSLKRGLAGYIVPSKLYGILAAGRPYVAAVEEESEVAAITKKYECGLLAEPGNAEDLVEKILTLYHDRALARRLGENARQAAFEFDRPVQVRAYWDLFQEVAEVGAGEERPAASKRALDMSLAGLGLLFSLPLWALIALAVKAEDGGPVFYAQDRVGKGGRRFRSLKFRTMVSDSDDRFGPLQAGNGDPRVTRVGRLLRPMALDELPQLWSVFKGEMSFVGPRALLPEEIEVNGNGEQVPLESIPGYEARHRVRPGLTGLAQVYAPRDILRRHKFKFDRLYIKKQTFWLDLKLIGLSVWISLRGKWEARGRKV